MHPPPPKQHLLAVGTQTGLVQIWDVAAEKKLRTMSGHSSRVGMVTIVVACPPR